MASTSNEEVKISEKPGTTTMVHEIKRNGYHLVERKENSLSILKLLTIHLRRPWLSISDPLIIAVMRSRERPWVPFLCLRLFLLKWVKKKLKDSREIGVPYGILRQKLIAPISTENLNLDQINNRLLIFQFSSHRIVFMKYSITYEFISRCWFFLFFKIFMIISL